MEKPARRRAGMEKRRRVRSAARLAQPTDVVSDIHGEIIPAALRAAQSVLRILAFRRKMRATHILCEAHK